MLNPIEAFLHSEGNVFPCYKGSIEDNDREASLRSVRAEGEYKPRTEKIDQILVWGLFCPNREVPQIANIRSAPRHWR